MNQVFKVVKLVEMSFLQRTFKQYPAENSIIEVNNLLANQEILSITPTQISSIESKYSLSLLKEFGLNMQEFYAVYWNQYLRQETGKSITEDETSHLIQIFGLDATTVSLLQSKIGEAWFKERTILILTGHLTYANDLLLLDKLRQKAKLSEAIAKQILNEAKQKLFEKHVETLASKNSCTPNEAAEVYAMIASFDISVEIAKDTKKKLDQLKYHWELENLPLKAIPVSVALQRLETCFLKIDRVKWFETRAAGRGNQQYELINEGSVYLTNKRLLFEGNLKTSIITYDKITRVSLEQKGILVHKEKGKEPILAFSNDMQPFNVILTRLLKEAKDLVN